MMVFTAKLKKKNLLILGAALLAVLLLLLWPGKKDAPQENTAQEQAEVQSSDPVKFLESFGWKVGAEPLESGNVRVPEKENEIFTRYNELQKSQGFDLSQYAGEIVKRCVYEVVNGSPEDAPCRATVFILKDRIIGGDISSGGPEGKMHGFRMP